MTENTKIKEWYYNNTKLYKKDDMIALEKYIEEMDIEMEEINISADYTFHYIADMIQHIRYENIFKLNFLNICKNLSEYFPKLEITCEFEKPSLIDLQLQKGNATFKHDVYITITDNLFNKTYDCVVEYFEEKSHKKKPTDYDKMIHTQQIVDYYIVYREEDNMLGEFYHNMIHKLMTMCCTANRDHYTLAKVNFFKLNQDKPKKIKQQTETFNNIISFNKKKKFNFQELFIELKLKNPETKELFDIKEFIEYMEENYEIIIDLDKKGNSSYDTFEQIIININGDLSQRLQNYKNIYREAVRILFTSQKEIIELIDEINKKKEHLPTFINNFLLLHIMNYTNSFTLKEVYKNLKMIKL